jgi:hypothetical protein
MSVLQPKMYVADRRLEEIRLDDLLTKSVTTHIEDLLQVLKPRQSMTHFM